MSCDQPDETINSMMKRDQIKPRRSKGTVGVSLLILFFRFNLLFSSVLVSMAAVLSNDGKNLGYRLLYFPTMFCHIATGFCYVVTPVMLLLYFLCFMSRM